MKAALLDGRTAIVTGASSGIGHAVAVAMAAAGANVVPTGRDEQRTAACAADCDAAGGRAHPVAIDLTADGAPERLVAATLERYGSLDVIVHSAGIFEPVPLRESTVESFDRQWHLNVRAPFALTRAAVDELRDGGVVLFISSIAGHVAFPNSAAYCATKGAIEMMTKALAVELAGEGIRVNALAPGNIRTPMNEHLLASPEYEASMVEQTPFGRVGVVEDIAPVAVFLASEGARYVHGASLLVDGGWAAR